MDIQITKEPIDYAALVERIRSVDCGAVVLFLGTARDFSEGRPVASLSYEAHVPMAEKQLAQLVAQAKMRWPIRRAVVVHRYGQLALGDIAVAVVTASAHRAEAFESARWIMDAIKQVVPIWKQEHWQDGPAEWVHPATPPVEKYPA